jgi:hypothetical protein
MLSIISYDPEGQARTSLQEPYEVEQQNLAKRLEFEANTKKGLSQPVVESVQHLAVGEYLVVLSKSASLYPIAV